MQTLIVLTILLGVYLLCRKPSRRKTHQQAEKIAQSQWLVCSRSLIYDHNRLSHVLLLLERHSAQREPLTLRIPNYHPSFERICRLQTRDLIRFDQTSVALDTRNWGPTIFLVLGEEVMMSWRQAFSRQ